MTAVDTFTATTDAAADLAAGQEPPADNRPALAEVVDESGWYPGRPDYGRWGVGLAGST